MAQEFFNSLIECIRREGEACPGQTIDPGVLREFMAGSVPKPVPASAAVPVARPALAPAPPASSAPSASPQPARRPLEFPRPAPQQLPAGGGEPSVAPGQPRIAPPPVSLQVSSLDELRPVVLECRRCILADTRHKVVFGEGDPHAKLMFIGEGPGYDEDMQGRPFVGKAGQLLDKMIAAMQFRREEVYIANVVKCRPPGNRQPTPDEAAACIGYLKKQIELIRPEVIVLLGATAVNFLLGKREGITRLRGKWLGYDGIPTMPTFHPAFLLRQESAKRDAWADLQQVMKIFGKVHGK